MIDDYGSREPEAYEELSSEAGVFDLEDEDVLGPSLFARLARSRTLVIVVILAFLLLILGPSLYWIFHRPDLRRPAPTRTHAV